MQHKSHIETNSAAIIVAVQLSTFSQLEWQLSIEKWRKTDQVDGPSPREHVMSPTPKLRTAIATLEAATNS